ncbi:MAG: winged helix-turn-helix transcriptional regulator [Candidatus Baltobacteraceae bacterium]
MLKETRAEIVFCGRFQAAIELVGGRWTGAIVRSLFNGPQRFNALLCGIPGLSDRLLAQRLKQLETKGLVRRDVAPGPPVCVSYELTEAGRELQQALAVLGSWAERWIELPTTG